MSTDLSPDQNEYLDFLVTTGRFPSRAAALDEAVDLLQEKEIRQRVEEGVRQLESGEYIVIKGDDELRAFLDDVEKRGKERLAARQDKAS